MNISQLDSNKQQPSKRKRKVRARSTEKLKPMRAPQQVDMEDGSNPNCHKVATESPNIFISNLQEEDDVLVTERDDFPEPDHEDEVEEINRQQSKLDTFFNSVDQQQTPAEESKKRPRFPNLGLEDGFHGYQNHRSMTPIMSNSLNRPSQSQNFFENPVAQQPQQQQNQDRIRITSISSLLQTLKHAEKFEVNGQSYAIEVDNQEINELLNLSQCDINSVRASIMSPKRRSPQTQTQSEQVPQGKHDILINGANQANLSVQNLINLEQFDGVSSIYQQQENQPKEIASQASIARILTQHMNPCIVPQICPACHYNSNCNTQIMNHTPHSEEKKGNGELPQPILTQNPSSSISLPSSKQILDSEDPSQTEQQQTIQQSPLKSQKNEVKIKLDFNYDSSRYENKKIIPDAGAEEKKVIGSTQQDTSQKPAPNGEVAEGQNQTSLQKRKTKVKISMPPIDMNKYNDTSRIPDQGAGEKKIVVQNAASTAAVVQPQDLMKKGKKKKVQLNLKKDFDPDNYKNTKRIPDAGAGEKKIVENLTQLESSGNMSRIPDEGAGEMKVVVDQPQNNVTAPNIVKKKNKVNIKIQKQFDMDKYNDTKRIPDSGAGEKKVLKDEKIQGQSQPQVGFQQIQRAQNDQNNIKLISDAAIDNTVNKLESFLQMHHPEDVDQLRSPQKSILKTKTQVTQNAKNTQKGISFGANFEIESKFKPLQRPKSMQVQIQTKPVIKDNFWAQFEDDAPLSPDLPAVEDKKSTEKKGSINLFQNDLFGNDLAVISAGANNKKGISLIKKQSQADSKQEPSKPEKSQLAQQMLLNALTRIAAQGERNVTKKFKGKTDLLFLHASPNLLASHTTQNENSKIQYSQLPALDFRKESKTIKSALTEAKKEIIYKSKVATKSNFVETMSRKPNVLHISCHGVKNTQNTMGMSYNQNANQGHFLLFENEHGDGELVSAQQLGDFMKKAKAELDVVFVAACQSEEIGRIFQQNGAKHVVCVESNRFVLDDAAISFTKTFYYHIFSGDDICTAFDIAKRAVGFKIRQSEAELFLILLQEDHQDEFSTKRRRKKKHQCNPLPEFNDGQWTCKSEHNLVKFMPSKVAKFSFREKDMSKLLEIILADKERIVNILGLHGIGKSCLARNTLHYVAERKLFTGGIIFIQLKEVKNCFGMLKLIMKGITKNLDLNNEEKRNLQSETFAYDDMIEYLINYFNHKIEQTFKKETKFGKNKNQNSLFLLCIDNASLLIEDDKEEFVYILSQLYDECPQLRILVTSCRDFGSLPNNQNAKPYLLQQLKQNDSVELFLDNCGAVTPQEIYELIIKDEKYPYKKFLPSHHQDQQQLTPEQLKELRKKVNNSQNWTPMLACHDMFRHFMGNPTTISMMASIHQNPMITDTLVGMYDRIKSETNIVFEELNYDNQDGKAVPRLVENIMSLKVAAEMSVQLLETTHPEDMNLLYLFGCLPGGLTEIQLESMQGQEFMTGLDRLKGLGFFDTEDNKLTLTVTMFKYIQSNMDITSKDDYMHNVCDYFKELLIKFYNSIGNTEVERLLQQKTMQSKQQSRKSIKFSEQIKEFGKDNEIFEQMNNELQNIDNCINFLLEKSGMVSDQVQCNFTKIASNANFQNAEIEKEDSGSDLMSQDSDASSFAVMKQDSLRNSKITVRQVIRKRTWRDKSKQLQQQHTIRNVELEDIKEEEKSHSSFCNSDSAEDNLMNEQDATDQISHPDQQLHKQQQDSSQIIQAFEEQKQDKSFLNTSKISNQDLQNTSITRQAPVMEITGVIKLGIGERQISESSGSFLYSDEEESEDNSQLPNIQDVEDSNTIVGSQGKKSESPNKVSDGKDKMSATQLMMKTIKEALLQKARAAKKAREVTQRDFYEADNIKVTLNRTKVKRKMKVVLRSDKHKLELSAQNDAVSQQSSFGRLQKPGQQRDNMKRSLTQMKPVTSTIWVPMTIEGQFITLMCADTYLINDYEYSLRIATADVSFIANTPLFEGNILRLRALASIEIFRYEMGNGKREDTQNMQDNYNYLMTAIASLENALAIYEAKEVMQEFEKNHYGMSLSLFTLGYIYKTFAKELSQNNELFAGLSNAEHAKYFVDSVKQAKLRAQQYFKKAFMSFKIVNHLFGMMLCKTYILELLPAQTSQNTIDKATKDAGYHERKYTKYTQCYGIQKSCHIPREHGPDVSLMIEIVFAQQYISLFPKEKDDQKDPDYEKLSESSSDGDDQDYYANQAKKEDNQWDLSSKGLDDSEKEEINNSKKTRDRRRGSIQHSTFNKPKILNKRKAAFRKAGAATMELDNLGGL